MASRTQLIDRAKISEQAERYDDMAKAMREVVQLGEALTTEERNLLSVAFKNIVGAKRSSWRVISSLAQKAEDEENRKDAEDYRKEIEDEVDQVCKEVMKLLDENLIKLADAALSAEATATNAETAVFYYKMKADYYRYMAEIKKKDDRKEPVESAKESYEKAYKIATMQLKSTNPIRLGLALNYSVFHYEIANQPAEACQLAKQAFDDAIAELDSLPEDSYKDSTLIMQLLRDNLTLWTADGTDEGREDGE